MVEEEAKEVDFENYENEKPGFIEGLLKSNMLTAFFHSIEETIVENCNNERDFSEDPLYKEIKELKEE